MPEHLDLSALNALQGTPPPTPWTALDAEYEREPEVRYLRDEPTLAQCVAPWLWGMLGFIMGAVCATAMFAAGGGR